MPYLVSDSEIASLLRRTRTIAVVGLSDNPARDSYRVAAYLRDQGYEIFPVNPLVHSVFGERVYPDLASIGHAVDVVDVFRRPEFVREVAEAAVRTGARGLWLQFDTVNEEAAAMASAAGLEVVVDRCMMADHRRLLG